MANADEEKAAGAQNAPSAATPPAPQGKQPASSSSAASPPVTESSESKFTREVWKEHAKRRLGVSKHAVHGALHDAAADDEFTEQEVKQRLGFLTKPLEDDE